MTARTLATILCGQCAGKREPCRLGTVEAIGNGIVLWRGRQPRMARAYRKQLGFDPVDPVEDKRTLRHPGISDLNLPDQLRAYCRVCGPGSVSPLDVLNARGSMPVPFTATV